MPISVTDSISPAIARAKYITFQPFNISKWFALGFIVFLAMLDENAGNYRVNSPFPGRGGTVVFPTPRPTPAPTTRGPVTYPTNPGQIFEDQFKEILHWMSTHVGLLIAIAIGGAIAFMLVWLLVLWINCRAKFMLLEAIANNTFQIVEPWKRFRPLGNSLFRFRAALTAIGLGAFLVLGLLAFAVALPDIRSRSFGNGAISAILLMTVIFIPLGVTFSLINWVTNYFITHIMFATGQSTLSAWSEFRNDVLPGNRWKFFLFLMMQGLLAIAVGILQGMLVCATCFIGSLPYLSSVLALPLHVFMRTYPIYFLQQFSARYQIITEPPQGGFPVLPLAGPGGYPPPPMMPMSPPGTMPPPSLPPPYIPPPRY